MSNLNPDPTTNAPTAPVSADRDVEGNDAQPSQAELAEAQATADNDLLQALSGSVADAKSYIERNPGMASKALAHENSQGTPRTTLTSYLEKVAGQGNR